MSQVPTETEQLRQVRSELEAANSILGAFQAEIDRERQRAECLRDALEDMLLEHSTEREEQAERLLTEVKGELQGDANFGRVVELLFYAPLRQAESDLRTARALVRELRDALGRIETRQLPCSLPAHDPVRWPTCPRCQLDAAVEIAVEAKSCADAYLKGQRAAEHPIGAREKNPTEANGNG